MKHLEYGGYIEWLQERRPIIPEHEFAFWMSKAIRELEKVTFGRVCGDDASEYRCVTDVAFQLAEHFYMNDNPENAQIQSRSESVGDYSISETYARDSSADYRDIIAGLLYCDGKPTGLLYRGG